ncbi:MAG: GGDEF domain-containing protein [Clostridia bacterium]|nr:GGDEF domain-containing protein [Clostridia bacterium]
MRYEYIAILALTVLLITNYDFLFRAKQVHHIAGQRAYRAFLVSVGAFFLADLLWGIFDSYHLYQAAYVDTMFFFLAMAATVIMWMLFVSKYTEEGSVASTILITAGGVFVVFQVCVVIVNCFFKTDFMFWMDDEGNYHAGIVRDISYIFQIVLFASTAVYAFLNGRKYERSKKKRHYAIASFGVVMGLMIVIQIFFPLIPLNTMGYLIGTCILHVHVLESERDDYRNRIEQALIREKIQQKELGEFKNLAYTDSLTQVKSKLAYLEDIAELDRQMKDGTAASFAVAVFDLNGLKKINDKYGHDAGDRAIVEASNLISKHFANSKVYRIGGDEFVSILTDGDYKSRRQLIEAFKSEIGKNAKAGKVVVSVGMSSYMPGADIAFSGIFERADRLMYEEKISLR